MRQHGLVLTCEHASLRLPSRVGSLGLTTTQRRSHIAWDKGAAQLTRALAARLECPAFFGRYSRLVVDLNRSPHHPRVVPKVAFGIPVPRNAVLSAAERAQRIATYHTPWREEAFRLIERAARTANGCVHLSIHSFTPQLHGAVRHADVGLLYDPARARERELAAELKRILGTRGTAVRRNHPYRGTNDGFTTWCRRLLAGPRYIGLEIELSQRHAGRRRVQRRVVEAVAEVLGAGRRTR